MGWLIDRLLTVPAPVALLVVFLLPALEASLFAGFIFPGEIAILLGGVLAHEHRVSLPWSSHSAQRARSLATRSATRSAGTTVTGCSRGCPAGWSNPSTSSAARHCCAAAAAERCSSAGSPPPCACSSLGWPA